MTENNVFLVAEIGVNHNGSINQAKKMIDAAKIAGADAVKFQTFTAKSLVSESTPKVPYQESGTSPDESHYEMIKSLELKREDHFLLKSYCQSAGIEFISTPYDVESAKFLHEELNVRLFKTASADIVDLPLHQYIASTGKHSLISVGMATLGEIEEVIDIYLRSGNPNITLLHCVSNYPCTDKSLNLNVMTTLAKAFQLPVGYSDHSIGYEAAVLSVALGATIVEKHFTLDKNLPGPDHLASCTPEEFAQMKVAVRRAQDMLGSNIKRCQDEEKQMAMISRKSITLASNIKSGTKIEKHHLIMQRPGTGLMAKDLNKVCGLRVKSDLDAGHQITFSDLS
jgi:N,N'-diacetyllegionaminate synthase